ncbi:hypothetical protein CTAYLR_006049 [Chrysophaeum taylorii]|uniref:Uncharacterized protein n=1 Tax=Chrysophaeum taylorii TaxID=2483200 RepID=A0AAD7XLE1_9STRA|nr:hypothetical protein CTAYLR_006049 [Chrysophaeum taylorii]
MGQAGPNTASTIQAFELGDSAASRELHDRPEWEEDGHNCGLRQLMENERLEAAMAGACATLIAGSALCDVVDPLAWRRSVAVLGVAGSVAYGFRQWSFDKWYRRHYAREYAREKWELENYEQGEKAEMVGLFAHKGLDRSDAEAVVGTMSASKEFFVCLMMTEELQLREPLARDEARAATSALCYALAALAPVATAEFAAGDGIGCLIFDLLCSWDDTVRKYVFLAVGVILLGCLGARRAAMSILAVHTHAMESLVLGILSAFAPMLISRLLVF